MSRWSVFVFGAALVAAACLAFAGHYAMTENPEPGPPFDSREGCEQYQIDHRVWLPPEACDPSVFTGDTP